MSKPVLTGDDLSFYLFNNHYVYVRATIWAPLVQSPKESWFLEDLFGASLNITPKESRFHTKRSLIKKIECIQHFYLLLKRSLLHAHQLTTASCQNRLSWYHSSSIHWASLGVSFNMQYPLRDGYRFSTNIKDYWRKNMPCLLFMAGSSSL